MIQQGAAGTQQGASSLAFSVTVPTAGVYTVTARYTAARAYVWTMSVYVNNQDVTQAQFPSTASWTSWATQTISVALAAGANTVMYRYDNDDSGWINLDYIQVSPDPRSVGYATGGASAAGWFPQEVAVDKFTGTARVNIPLANVTAPGISVPVSLAYVASGVSVDEVGSTVGVNWSLQAGISIRREVRGLPDDVQSLSSTENRYGWLRYPSGSSPGISLATVNNAPSTINPAGCDATEIGVRGQLEQMGGLPRPGSGTYNMYDTEPDVFYYSLPDHSGKFVFDAQGQVHTIPYDPISITPGAYSYNGISSFTIKTPNGNTYFFGNPDCVSERTSSLLGTPKFFLRNHFQFNLPGTQTVSLTRAWHITSILSPVNNLVEFGYELAPTDYGSPESRQMHRFLQATNSGVPTAEYQTTTQYTTTQWLTSIRSPSTLVQFELFSGGMDERSYTIKSVSVSSRLAWPLPDILLKKYTLNYTMIGPDRSAGQRWNDEKGANIDLAEPRRFLSGIQLTTGTITQPLYSFAYHRVGSTTAPLPPIGAAAKDYWGYYNDNKANTLIPQLYLYPALLSLPGPPPAAPYRLFEAADYASSGVVLPGADRRPAADFNTTLTGTLTEMTFTGGGKVLFDYEPHRFYDPIARKSLPAGGTRLRALRAQDPVTKIEVRRDYDYQEDNGSASGVLLNVPRFAFAVPAAGATLNQQWTNATVRSGTDLAVDDFEGRSVGYHQVGERMLGKGRVVTVFEVAGSADEAAVAATANCVGWQRPVVGVARQYTSNCPSVAPLQAGTEIYPFAPAPNFSFRRGQPLRIQTLAEPVGTAAGVLLRQQDFVYQYRYPKGTAVAIPGLAYEQTGNTGDRTYVYAKYSLLADFQYVVRQETVTEPNAGVASRQARVGYRYNNQGWLAAVGQQNSDGSFMRTRYKYLTDYALSSNSTEPQMQAMYQRLNATAEQINSDVVETISEVVTPAGDVRFKGATLTTFKTEAAINSMPSLTHPYQVWRWNQLAPLPLANTIDSTRLLNNELHISSNYKPVSTIAEVDPLLRTTSTREVTGRKVRAQHLGYAGELPVLQIANALASEVVYSDFEAYKDRRFNAYSSGSTTPTPTAAAARTGKYGQELLSDAYLLSSLPSSTASQYRLTVWAKASQSTTVDITFTGSSALTSQTLQVEGNNQWKLYELALDWSSAALTPSVRNACSMRIQPRNTIQVDDVTLLPANAATASTTYDLAFGKSSETDNRGRTTYYEYGPSGALTTVRNHNKAIMQQYDQVVAGRYQSQSASLRPSFTVTGTLVEENELVFTVDNSPSFGQSYTWDFNDGSAPVTTSSSTIRHTYAIGGLYHVKLQVSNQGRVYEVTQDVSVARKLFTITPCISGVVAIDDCVYRGQQTSVGCGSNTSTTSTTLSVTANLPGPYTYSWEVLQDFGAYTTWNQIPNATSSSFNIATPRSSGTYRCRVTAAGGYEGVSESLAVEHYCSR